MVQKKRSFVMEGDGGRWKKVMVRSERSEIILMTEWRWKSRKILRMTISSFPLYFAHFLLSHDEHLGSSSGKFLRNTHSVTASLSSLLLYSKAHKKLFSLKDGFTYRTTRKCWTVPRKQFRKSHPFDSYPFLALILLLSISFSFLPHFVLSHDRWKQTTIQLSDNHWVDTFSSVARNYKLVP